jgi:phosphotransferase system  glucose/maltose/N-acetylglucosamine-specific IIC component
VGDLAIVFLPTLVTVRLTASAAVDVFLIYGVPLLANSFAMWWAHRSGKKKWLKGIIISTAMLILLDGTCFGLLWLYPLHIR